MFISELALYLLSILKQPLAKRDFALRSAAENGKREYKAINYLLFK